jgi:hypothetical protein
MPAERLRNEQLFCTGLGGTLLASGECPALAEPAWTCRIALSYGLTYERRYSGAVPAEEAARCARDRGTWTPAPPP